MDGIIPDPVDAPQEKIELTDYTKGSLKWLREHFEMEAVLRVAIIVMQATSGLEVTVQLQPSLEGHPVFTYFYFVVKEGGRVPVAFIEVSVKGTRRLMRVSACSQTATSMPLILLEVSVNEPFLTTYSQGEQGV